MGKKYFRPGNKTNHDIQTIHGFCRAGKMHPLYRVWLNIKNRCYNVKFGKGNEIYLNKKITVCDEWINSASNFINWGLANGWEMGLCIDRIDSSKGYTPDNCQFITVAENARKVHRDNPGYQTGINNARSKLTEENVKEIKRLIAKGLRNPEISVLFSVKPGAISQIRCGTNWKHVT